MPIRMTAAQEQKAKDRLSLKKNFDWKKAKEQKMAFKRLALAPFTMSPTGEQMPMGQMPKSLKVLRDGEEMAIAIRRKALLDERRALAEAEKARLEALEAP